MSRSSCPPGLEKKLDREVHYYCPICGGMPLVRAHTVKVYSEVGWHYDYLLSICIECERKIENGSISRSHLHEIKQKLRLSFSHTERIRPHQISLPKNKAIFMGSNHFASTNVIFKYKDYPIVWFEDLNGVRVLNARFYDAKGTVVTAIDRNQWTADKSRFYNIESITEGGVLRLRISGKQDDTNVEFLFEDKGLTIGPSIFYIPGNKIQILSNGDLMIGTNTFSNCGMFGVGAAFAFS